MKQLLALKICLLAFLSFPLYAQTEGLRQPLKVAVDNFTPPFVMAGANSQLFGFDISMMDYICRTIERHCIFIPMPFNKILNAVATKKVDVAVSAITITNERATSVLFSIPYLVSKVQFIGLTELAKQPFSKALLDNHNIGIVEGTLFPSVLELLSVRNAKITSYENSFSLIDALQLGKIDLALMDAPSARYWHLQSSGKLSVLGEPLTFGYGFGIAVNRRNRFLVNTINEALISYENSKEFKRDYNKYIANF